MPLWRRIAGLAVLGAILFIGAALIPPYLKNMRFQRYLDDAVETRQKPETLQAAIVNRAAQMGLPVRSSDVRIEPKPNGVRVEILYVVRVDLPLYTVDLHFHPGAAN